MQTMQNQQSPQKNGYGSEIATTQVDIAAAHLSHDLSGVNRSPLVSETPLAAQKLKTGLLSVRRFAPSSLNSPVN